MCQWCARTAKIAAEIWGWTDLTPSPDTCICRAYGKRFWDGVKERHEFPNPPQPWLESFIELTQPTGDTRWTYRVKLELYNNGCGGGYPIRKQPYPDRDSALLAAIISAHTWLSRQMPDDKDEEIADDDELGSYTYTKNERKLEQQLRGWLDSLTQPAQMTLI
jgi:hypothetical protein